MDTPKPLQKSVHLLDDLESIRQLLGDDNLQPPLLTDTVEEGEQEQIPMLFDTVSGKEAFRLTARDCHRMMFPTTRFSLPAASRRYCVNTEPLAFRSILSETRTGPFSTSVMLAGPLTKSTGGR